MYNSPSRNIFFHTNDSILILFIQKWCQLIKSKVRIEVLITMHRDSFCFSKLDLTNNSPTQDNAFSLPNPMLLHLQQYAYKWAHTYLPPASYWFPYFHSSFRKSKARWVDRELEHYKPLQFFWAQAEAKPTPVTLLFPHTIFFNKAACPALTVLRGKNTLWPGTR